MRKAFAAAVLLLAACDDLLSADLQIPSIEVTLPGQEFPESDTGAPEYRCDPSAPQSFPPCLALNLDYDLGGQVPVLDERGVTYDLRLTDVALTLSATQTVSGDKDLSGVAQATIRVLDDPALPGPGAVLATYVRPPITGPVSAFTVSGNANLGLGPYLEAGRLPIRVELLIDSVTPTPAFTADVRAGFSLEVSLDYDALL
jgi:hypothetical protein